MMLFKQLVEFRSIASGEPRSVGNVAVRDPQDAHEISSLEILFGVLQRLNMSGLVPQRLLRHSQRDNIGIREGAA